MSVFVSFGQVVRRRAGAFGVTWPEQAAFRAMRVRALKVALSVGTCLTLINQGDAIFGGQPAATLLWKVPLTYCVPFCVSLYSAMAATQPRR